MSVCYPLVHCLQSFEELQDLASKMDSCADALEKEDWEALALHAIRFRKFSLVREILQHMKNEVCI